MSNTQSMDEARFLEVLESATLSDLLFTETSMTVHSLETATKTACHLISVRGTAVPNPDLVMYIRGLRERETFWYVLDHSVPRAPLPFQELKASSEQEAKEIVLHRLREAYRRNKPGHHPNM